MINLFKENENLITSMINELENLMNS